jgi:hypothetical protein
MYLLISELKRVLKSLIAIKEVKGFEETLFALKGQLISKWVFGVVDFLQKMNENKST